LKRQDKYRNLNYSDLTRRNSWDDPGFEMLLSPADSALFKEISDVMKGSSDIEDVKSDPAYSITNDEVKVMISDYQKNRFHNEDNEKFIIDSLTEETKEDKLRIEINTIKDEIRAGKINDVASEWVDEWEKKSESNNHMDARTDEIRNFITSSFRVEESSNEKQSAKRKRSGLTRSLVIRYSSLAAAAVIVSVFFFRSLLITEDPQRMFNKYYTPFMAVSSVTRSSGLTESKTFTKAIDSYKAGDYRSAAVGFSEAMLNSADSFSASFFLGITEIELGNYAKAINLLNGVVNQKSGFTKEAYWYLGLAYIKSGNKIKASGCFEILARSPGFYANRSEKILRLLR
jgi:TolA-binding protein